MIRNPVTAAIASGRAPTMEEVAEVMTHDTWKTTEWWAYDTHETEKPCKWEVFSGICMVCGAGPDDECEYEREQRRGQR